MAASRPSFQANLKNAAWDQMVVKLRTQEDALAKARGREQELQEELRRISSDCNPTNKDLELANDAFSKAKEQLTAVQKEHAAAVAAKVDTESRLTTLQTQNQEILELSERMAADLSSVQSELARSKDSLRAKSEQIRAAQEQTSLEISTLQNDLANARFELVDTQGTMDRLKHQSSADVETLKHALANMEKTILSKENELGLLEAKIENHESEKTSSYKETDNQCAVLRESIAAAEFKLQESRTKQAELLRECQDAEKALSAERSSVTELKDKLEGLEAAVDKHEEMMHQKTNEHENQKESLLAQINQQKYECLAHQNVITELNSEIQSMRREHQSSLESSQEQHEQQLLLLRQEMIVSSRETLARVQSELEEARSRNNQVQAVLARHEERSTKYNKSQESLSQLKDKLSALEIENDFLRKGSSVEELKAGKFFPCQAPDDHKALCGKIKELEAQNDALRWSHAAVGTELDSTRLELVEREALVAEYEQQLEFIQTTLQQLGSERNKVELHKEMLASQLEKAGNRIEELDSDLIDIRAGNVILQTKFETLSDKLLAEEVHQNEILHESEKAKKLLAEEINRTEALKHQLVRSATKAAQDEYEITRHFMKETSELKSRITAADKRVKQTSDSLALALGAADSAHRQLSYLTLQAEKGEKRRNLLTEEKHCAEAQLAERERDLKVLALKLDGAVASKSTDDKRLREQKVEIDKLHSDIQTFRASLVQAQESIGEFKVREQALVQELEEVKGDLARATEAVAELEGEKDELEDEVNQAREKLQELERKQRDVDEVSAELGSTRESLASVRGELEAIITESLTLRRSQSDLRLELQNTKERLVDRDLKLEEMSSLSETLENEAQSKLAELYSKWEAESNRSTALALELKDKQASLQRAVIANDTLAERKRSGEEAQEASRKDMNALVGRLEESQAESRELQNARDLAEKKITGMTISVGALENQISGLKSAYGIFETEKIEERKELDEKLSLAESAKREVEAKLAESERTSKSMQNSIANMKEALARKDVLVQETRSQKEKEIRELEEEVAVQGDRLRGIEMKRKEETKRFDEQTKRLERTEKFSAEVQEKYIAQKSRAEQHAEMCETLSEEISILQQKDKELRQKLQDVEDAASEARAELIERLRPMERDLAAQLEEQEKLKILDDKRSAELGDVQESFSAAQTTISGLEIQCRKAEEDAKSLSADAAGYRSKCGHLESALSEVKNHVLERDSSLKRIREENDELECALQKRSNEIDQLKESLERALSCAMDHKANLKASEDLLKDGHQTREDLRTLRAERAAHDKEIADLREKIESKEEEAINALFKYDSVLKKNNKLKLKIRRLEAIQATEEGQENVPLEATGKKVGEIAQGKRQRGSKRSVVPLAVRSDL